VQVSAQVLAQNKAAQQRQDAEDFQTTLNELAIQKEAYERGEIPSSVLLQDYEAARSRFEDPQHQAQLIQFGEPFKTRLVEETENRQVAAAAGFLQNKFLELSDALTQDEEFVTDISSLPFPEQLEAIRGELISTFPPDMLETISNNPELQAAVTRQVRSIAATTQRARQDILQQQETRIRRLAVDKGITDILGGASVSETFTTLQTKQGIPEEEVVTQVAESLVGNIKSAEATGSLPELSHYLSTAEEVLEQVSPRYGKERSDIAAAMSRAEQSMGVIITETLTNRANVARAAGATDEEVRGAVVDRILSEAEVVFGQDFDTEASFLSYQPQNQTERGIHQTMLDAYKSVQAEVAERSKTVNNAITATVNPDNAPQSAIVAPLSFGPEDLNPYLDGLQESIVSKKNLTEEDQATLQMLDAARDSRPALYHMLSSVNRETSGAGAVAKAAGSEHLSGQTVTEEGLAQVFAVIEGLGGAPNTYLVADGDANKDYALGKAYNSFLASGVIDPNVYNSAYQQAQQHKFKTRSGNSQTYAEALNDPKIAERLTGVPNASFDQRTLSVILQSTSIGDIPEGSFLNSDSDYIVSTVREHARKNGIYFVQDMSQGNERPVYTYTTSNAVPEALGNPYITTRSMEKGLNNYLSQVDRTLASTMTNGEHKSLWIYARERVKEILPDGRAEDVLTLSELLAKKEKGEANIIIGSTQAGASVPIYLSLNEDGRNNRAMLLGTINFSESPSSSVFKSMGADAFKSPEDIRKSVEMREEARNMFPPLRPDQLPGKSAAQLEYEREVLGLDV
jgi:hypothetical protein